VNAQLIEQVLQSTDQEQKVQSRCRSGAEEEVQSRCRSGAGCRVQRCRCGAERCRGGTVVVAHRWCSGGGGAEVCRGAGDVVLRCRYEGAEVLSTRCSCSAEVIVSR